MKLFFIFFFLAVSCLAEKPNFLIIMADDAPMRDMEVYGGQAKTPYISKLATEGMKFTHCFQAAAMCAPTRMNLLTGIYPVRNGGFRNHSKAHGHMKSIVHHLKPLEYKVGLVGKRHVKPQSVFSFEYSKDKKVDFKFIDEFMDEAKAVNKAFCLFVMSMDPHVPWTQGDPSQYPREKLKLPPHLVDTAETRLAYSRYLAELTYFDSQVGRSLILLQKHGLEKNTLVIVLSEHGNLFPFEKWTCYDGGLQSAMIARFPGKVSDGVTSAAMVEYVDLVPTLVEFAGGEPVIPLDGKSFKKVLTGEATHHKEYVFGIQTTVGVNGCQEPYGIRSIRSKDFKLILNLHPENKFTNATFMDPQSWNEGRRDYLGWIESWRQKAVVDNDALWLLKRYQHRPVLELYKVSEDPYELTNLAANPEYADVVRNLKEKLLVWMESQGDKGREIEGVLSVKKSRNMSE